MQDAHTPTTRRLHRYGKSVAAGVIAGVATLSMLGAPRAETPLVVEPAQLAKVVPTAKSRSQAQRIKANEAAAIGSLRTLVSAQQNFKSQFRRYAGSLSQLRHARLVDAALASGVKSGYKFAIHKATASEWTCQAQPQTPGSTGRRFFFVDHRGVIRAQSGGPAGADDKPIE